MVYKGKTRHKEPHFTRDSTGGVVEVFLDMAYSSKSGDLG